MRVQAPAELRYHRVVQDEVLIEIEKALSEGSPLVIATVAWSMLPMLPLALIEVGLPALLTKLAQDLL